MTVLRDVKTLKSPRTLGRYVLDGAKYCLLAGGGKQNVLTEASSSQVSRIYFSSSIGCHS